MKEIETASLALKTILFGDSTFASALKDTFSKDEQLKTIRPIVASLLGCELRHHLLFEKLLTDTKKDFTEDEKCLIYIAFANNLFLKRLDNNDILNIIKTSLREEQFVEVEKILTFTESPIDLIPNDISRESNDFISLRFNTPVWLVKMWQKHFGRGLTFKLLKRNSKPQTLTVRVKTDSTKVEDIINENQSFKLSPINDILYYEGKLPNKRASFFRSFDVFPEKLSVKDLFDNLKISNLNNALFYLEEDNSPFYEMLLQYKEKINYNVAVPNLDEQFELVKSLRINNIKNVNLFNAPNPLEMEAAISCQQDLVVVYPNSSDFDKIRLYPDYLLKFKPENIDKLIARQKEILEGSSKYVISDGILVFITSTVDRKEGHSLIADFLQRHHEFSLVEEHQRFPFDKFDSCLFYAILKKDGEQQGD